MFILWFRFCNVDALPNKPNHWKILDFEKKATELHDWLFNKKSDAIGSSVFYNNTGMSRWYKGKIVSIPSYLGLNQDAAIGAGDRRALSLNSASDGRGPSGEDSVKAVAGAGEGIF